MAEMVRLNARISKEVHVWLEKRVIETGMPKSTIIFLALEQYMKQTDAMQQMKGMEEFISKIEDLKKFQQVVPEVQCPKCKEDSSPNSIERYKGFWKCHECGEEFK